jgi:hypothetical protein
MIACFCERWSWYHHSRFSFLPWHFPDRIRVYVTSEVSILANIARCCLEHDQKGTPGNDEASLDCVRFRGSSPYRREFIVATALGLTHGVRGMGGIRPENPDGDHRRS